MKCADPVLCYTINDKKIWRHFSVAKKLLIFGSKPDLVTDCGKCLNCRKKKCRELAMRCVLHSSLYKENCFLTLTYDETKKGYHNEKDYTDIQKFKKRLRIHVARATGRRIQIFNVHEYGKNGKKHWHLIVFNFDFLDKEFKTERNGQCYYVSDLLTRLWSHGTKYNQIIGEVSEASAMYQAQYMEKDLKNYNTNNSRKSDSKHSGLGGPYFLQNYRQILSLGYVPFDGRKLPVPRYFQKLAHKHFSHFYDPKQFVRTVTRGPVYRYSANFKPNKEIADLWPYFKEIKDRLVAELEESWSETSKEFLTTKQDPDFIQSNENALYDLQKKNHQERF